MVLAIGLISEVVILLIFDVFLFARGHVTAAPLNPVNAFKSFPAQGTLAAGAIGIGLFFAFWSWVGFEMAPNYGEESRDPKRIVPRALYISVIGLGVFYTITSWASLAGYPTTKAAIAVVAEQRGPVLPHPGQPLRRAVGVLGDELPDHHRLVRLRHGLPQHHRALSVLRSAARAWPRGPSARPTPGGRARTSRPSPSRSSPPSSSAFSPSSPAATTPTPRPTSSSTA